MAATNKYISFERGTTYWRLTNCNGSSSATVDSTVARDANWHTLDLLWLSDRTMVWLDGEFLVENTSYVPSVSTNERAFLQSDKDAFVSYLDVEQIRVVGDWS
jgi:hypothetical protein